MGIHGCKTDDHAGVDTCCGCKVFKPNSTKTCDFNMAWNFNDNSTITSVMSGKCLEALPSGSVEVNTCDDRETQHWSLSDAGGGRSVVRQASGNLCLADAAAPAPTPSPPPSPAGNVPVSIQLKDLGITSQVNMRDVWRKQDLGPVSDSFTTELAP